MQNQLKDAAKPQATTSTATPPAPVTSHAESGQQSTAETPEILAAKPLSDKATSDNPVVMELLISEITIDEGMQCRHEISKEAVRDYAEMIQAGDNFPPVTVFDIEGKKVLADGFHRYHAAKKSSRRTIKVAILNGSRNDALLFGIKANSQHGGLRFTNRDKKHAVCIVLRTFPKYSNGMVADLCRVSAPFVSKMRGVLESGKQPETVSSCLQRVGRDGKRRKLPSKKANAPETTASESSTYADVEKCETKPASIIANAAPDGKSDEADERANPVELDRPPVFDRELTPFAHIQRTIRTAWQQLPASDRPEFLKKIAAFMQELAGELPLESTAPVADPLVPSTENSSATEAGKVIDVASAPTAATIQPPVAPTIAQPVKTPRSSATAKKALAPTQHPRVKFDYEQVNWKLTNCEIAEIWNLKRHRVKQIRSDRNRGPAGKFPQEECERLKELERAKVAMWVSNHYDSINSTSAPESDQPKQPSTEVAS